SYRLPRDKRESFFQRHIDAMADRLKENPEFASNGAQYDPNHRSLWVRLFLTHYVEEYERLPRGRMTDDYSQIPLCNRPAGLGETDLDALARAGGAPPAREAPLHPRDEPAS